MMRKTGSWELLVSELTEVASKMSEPDHCSSDPCPRQFTSNCPELMPLMMSCQAASILKAADAPSRARRQAFPHHWSLSVPGHSHSLGKLDQANCLHLLDKLRHIAQRQCRFHFIFPRHGRR